ncbi:hypothetical protein A2U01_0096711, partial [Trifolium medium]|nr:hypothetical protein [Trifolium medium]
GERESREAQMAIEASAAEEEDSRTLIPTAFAITRAEDHLSLRMKRGR